MQNLEYIKSSYNFNPRFKKILNFVEYIIYYYQYLLVDWRRHRVYTYPYTINILAFIFIGVSINKGTCGVYIHIQ